MDFSKQYILMCEQAEELQDSWLPTYGDYVVSAQHCLRNKKSNPNLLIVQEYQYKDTFKKHIKKEEKLIYSFYKNGSRDVKHRVDKVWLPRQDQLQNILFVQKSVKACFWRDIHGLSKDFYLYAFQHPELKTFEQLWLAFIMILLYNKIFNSTEWVNK